MIKLKIITVKSSFKKILTNVLINVSIKSAVIKSILSATFTLKIYYLSFKIRKTAAEVLKHDFSFTKLLC